MFLHPFQTAVVALTLLSGTAPETTPADEAPKSTPLTREQVKTLLDKSNVSDKLKTLLAARYDAARTEVETSRLEISNGRTTVTSLPRASLHLLEAEKELSEEKTHQVSALEGHLQRVRDAEKGVEALHNAGMATLREVSEVRFYRLEAEIWLERARAK